MGLGRRDCLARFHVVRERVLISLPVDIWYLQYASRVNRRLISPLFNYQDLSPYVSSRSSMISHRLSYQRQNPVHRPLHPPLFIPSLFLVPSGRARPPRPA